MKFSLVTITSPHVLQWLGSPKVWVVTLETLWALTAGMAGTPRLWLWIIKVPMVPPLNLQFHILASSSLIQPSGRQRSTLWRCYSSEQWGLGLVKRLRQLKKSVGFLSSKKLNNWSGNHEEKLLCSQWQHCGIAVYRTHFIPLALATARITEICQTQGRVWSVWGQLLDLTSIPLSFFWNGSSVNSISPQLVLLPQLSIHFVP